MGTDMNAPHSSAPFRLLARTARACALVTVLVAVSLSLVACGGGGSSSDGGGGTAPETKQVTVTLMYRGALNEITESFKVGDELKVKDTGTLVGTITDVRVEPSKTAAPTSEGDLKEARSPIFSDVWLTVEGEAVISDAGAQFSGRYLYVNDEIVYLTPYVTFKGFITSIEPAE